MYEMLFGGMHMGGGYLRYKTTFLEALPFPDLTRNMNKTLGKRATQILSAKRNDSKAETTALEAEIDARVAHLYQLAEEEYSLILSELKPPDPFRVAALNFYRDIARGKIK